MNEKLKKTYNTSRQEPAEDFEDILDFDEPEQIKHDTSDYAKDAAYREELRRDDNSSKGTVVLPEEGDIKVKNVANIVNKFDSMVKSSIGSVTLPSRREFCNLMQIQEEDELDSDEVEDLHFIMKLAYEECLIGETDDPERMDEKQVAQKKIKAADMYQAAGEFLDEKLKAQTKRSLETKKL
jgi:hypothetical protein